MELVSTAVDNPLHADDLKGDSDAVLAPHLVLVQIYGKLMQLGPFMPPLLLVFALLNGYSRNKEYMPWEQKARCRVDSNTEFFKACEENHSWDHCQAFYCHVGDDLVHTDQGILGPDHHELLAPWTPGQPCPSGSGQRCFDEGELDPQYLHPLTVMYRCLAAVGSLFLGAVSFSFRRVSAPKGTLEILGLGQAKILEKEDRRLKRWQILMLPPIFIVNLFGIQIIPYGVVLESPMYWFVWPCVLSWYLALKEASVLVSDVVLEARKQVTSTVVLHETWDEHVVPNILELADKTLPDLSHGFGGGLFMCTLGLWSFSASAFASALEGTGSGLGGVVGGLSRSFVLFCFPLLIAFDVASASSDCDSLVNELNKKRKTAMDIQTDQKLQVLERALSHENAG